MRRPTVLLAPHFRRMDEIFDEPTLDRLSETADLVWARDDPMPQAVFERALPGALVLVFGTWHYGREAIVRHGQALQLVLEVAGSHRHPSFDYATCFARGVRVGSCAPAFGPAVAEMAIAMTLAARRRVVEGHEAFRDASELYEHAGNADARTLVGARVGFVGVGGLAASLHRLLEPFEVEVMGYDPWQSDEALRARSIEPVSLDRMFEECSVVYVLAIPTPENRGLVSRRLMEKLEPTDVLAVISRAHLVDFDALTQLVVEGRFRLVCDVWPSEPLEPNHPLRGAPGTVLSAHRAGAMPGALGEIGRMVVDDIECLIRGGSEWRMQYATPELIGSLRGATPG